MHNDTAYSLLGNGRVSVHKSVEGVRTRIEESLKVIEFTNSSTTHKVELFNISGKLISSESTEQATFNIKKNNLASGLYFLKVTAKNGESTTQKVMFN